MSIEAKFLDESNWAAGYDDGMKLKKLCAGMEVRGKDVEIFGISSHSGRTGPGDLFVAKGRGAQFIPEVIRSGAVAIVTDLYNPFLSIPQVICPDVSAIEGEIGKRFYRDPSSDLFSVGVTGTNGKTTVSYLVRHLLGTCGLIGTVEYWVGDHRLPAHLTTPDVLFTLKLFRDMVNRGCDSVAMEASSIGIEQGRIQGIEYDVAIFTNLSQDHMDYHGDMATYAGEKRKLFSQAKHVVRNGDETTFSDVDGITYGLEGERDFKAENIQLSGKGSQFTIQGVPFELPLVGRFNISNALAAIATGAIKGLSLEEMSERLKSFPGVPGRLEKIPHAGGAEVFVDYAHTPDALEKTLETLKEFHAGKITTVFGCGGDRDREKRPQMAKAVEKFSDQIIVTSDNARNEDPNEICRQITLGFKKSSRYSVLVDRKTAIREAVSQAKAGELVLIAGRGHEASPFDDREIAKLS